MAATFRCMQSGQLVTFVHQHDIDSMKGHSAYELVESDAPIQDDAAKPVVLQPPTAAPRRPGRPRKE